MDALRKANFRNEDISVLFPDNEGSKEFAHEKNTKAPEGATTGATTGVSGRWLRLAGGHWRSGHPRHRSLYRCRSHRGCAGRHGRGGAVGGITGALIGAGIPEYEAKRYEGRIKEGGILLSVHCDDSAWTKRAKEILERTGAEDISSTGEASADFDKSDRPLPNSREVA